MSDRKLPLDRSERILNELLRIPVNTICCDCGEANPKWASFNLGCFLCVRCCSVHRKMGTHISKVKSVSLDSWTQDDIDTMKNWGNGKVNALYMPHPERHPPPISREGSAMEQYIRSKYERKEFMEGGGNYQPSNRSAYGNTFSGGRGSGHTNDIVNTQSYTTQISALRAMGFTDHTKNLQVLQSTNGDVPNAIEILCRIGSGPVTSSANLASSNSNRNNSSPARSQPSRPSNTSSDPKETILWNMGFHDAAMNKEALRRAGGNPEVAAGILIDDKDKLAKAVHDKAGSSPLPARLDPPGSNRSQSNQNDNDLLLDLSTPEDNMQQQQQRQQFMMQQQMMQSQTQNAGMDQFGHNHNQLQSILDKNASILALYNDSNNNPMNGMNNMNSNMNLFGNNMNTLQQQQQMGVSGDTLSWSMSNMNNNNFNSAFGIQTSVPTGNSNMFGNNTNVMGASSPINPFGLQQQQSATQSSVGFNNNNSNNAFGNLVTSSAMAGNSNNMFGGLNSGMGGSSPMSSPFGTMNSNMGNNMNTNMNVNNNNAFGANQGLGGMNSMNGMGTMGTMGNMGNMGNMNNNNNNFNSAFGMNNNPSGHNSNPWGNNNNNNNFF